MRWRRCASSRARSATAARTWSSPSRIRDFTRDLEIARSRLVDVLLTGHDHDLRIVYDNRTVMVESGEEGEYVTAIDIYATIGERDGRRAVTWLPRFRVIDSGTVTPDPEALTIVKKYEGELSRELDVPLGTTAVDLDSRSASVGRRKRPSAISSPTPSGPPPAPISPSPTAAASRQKAVSGGRDAHPPRHPHGAALRQFDLAGRDHRKDVKDALENGVSQIDNRAGRFPQVSGMVVTIDPKQPAGSRIASVMVGGQPLDMAKTYRSPPTTSWWRAATATRRSAAERC